MDVGCSDLIAKGKVCHLLNRLHVHFFTFAALILLTYRYT